MAGSTPHITGAELKIMKILWQDGPKNVRQVKEKLAAEGGEEPAYTTVMTMMKQLAEKGALTVDRERQPFGYTWAVGRSHVMRQRVTQFLETVFDGQAADLVLHLAEDTNLSSEDLRRIEEKIGQREKQERRRSSTRSRMKGKKK